MIYDYHHEADILEVFFAQEEATAAVHLTPDIILHFRVEDGQAVSLIFNNFDHLILSDEYGPRAFRLEVERWPEPLRAVFNTSSRYEERQVGSSNLQVGQVRGTLSLLLNDAFFARVSSGNAADDRPTTMTER